MREVLDQWDFVVAAYSVALSGTVALTLWSWLSMVRAERRRDDSRRK